MLITGARQARMFAIVKEFRQSKMNRKEFCQQMDTPVNYTTLCRFNLTTYVTQNKFLYIVDSVRRRLANLTGVCGSPSRKKLLHPETGPGFMTQMNNMEPHWFPDFQLSGNV